jgi:hypothetical protein
MADLILPEDEDLLEKMLTVWEFDSEDERNHYLRIQQREKIKKAVVEGEVISIPSVEEYKPV